MFRARFATSPSDVLEKLNLNLRDIEAELARRPQAGPAAAKSQSLPIPSPSAVRHDATAGIDEGDIKHMTAAWVSGLTGGGSTALHSHSQYMLAAMRGAVNGVCELDANGLIPIGRVPASLLGGVRYQGVWNATTNTPTLATSPDSTTKGFYYKVSVAGTWNSISWAIGDWIISSGTSWDKVDNTDQVTSVFGRQGAITAQSGDYTPAQVGAEPAVTAGTVSQFWSGLKTWRDLAADVRAVVLTGLSTATNSAITATDSILVSLGKLQAQINARPAISVVDAVTDGSMSAITSNAVFDALQYKGEALISRFANGAMTGWLSAFACGLTNYAGAYEYGSVIVRVAIDGGYYGSYGWADVSIDASIYNGTFQGSTIKVVACSANMVGKIGTANVDPRLVGSTYWIDVGVWVDPQYVVISAYCTHARSGSLSVAGYTGALSHNVGSVVTTAQYATTAPAGSNDTTVANTAWVTAWVRGRLADTTVGNADKVDGKHVVVQSYNTAHNDGSTIYLLY